MNDVLAFDWGTSIVGVLDIRSGDYVAYRGRDRMIEGATRIVSAEGIVVSFNGHAYDFPKLFELLGLEGADCAFKAAHDDMLKITSNIRWPPDIGTGLIKGPGLRPTYEHFCGFREFSAPAELTDIYERDNWRDCYMAAELWRKWKSGELSGGIEKVAVNKIEVSALTSSCLERGSLIY